MTEASPVVHCVRSLDELAVGQHVEVADITRKIMRDATVTTLQPPDHLTVRYTDDNTTELLRACACVPGPLPVGQLEMFTVPTTPTHAGEHT